MKAVLVLVFALWLIPVASPGQPYEVARGVLIIGNIQNLEISESSGIAPSRRGRGLFWTHNDSGPDTLFAIQPNGAVSGQFKLKDTELQNWEDIAAGGRWLYIADIGNNNASRDSVDIYAVVEPNPRRSGEVRPARRWNVEYPGNAFDAESFFISRGYGYIIRKESGNARVYRFRLGGKRSGQWEEQCSLNMNFPATGADITPDNRRLAVITDNGAYLFAVPRRIPVEGTLDPVLFVPFALPQMEACTFTRDGLIATAESGEILLFTNPQFQLRSGPRVQ